MSPHAKVPRNPPAKLRHRPQDLLHVEQPLWRIHRTQGDHLIPWNGFRTFGPTTARYDPHPEPRGEHPGHGVSYTATDLKTAAAEVFQTSRRIDTITDAPYATSWTPTRMLQLLDLTSDWALLNGAAHSLAHASRPTCRAWSRAIHHTWPHLDGLWAPSTMTGQPMVVLYEPAAPAMPTHPAFSEPLAAAVTWSVMARISADIGYTII